MWGREMNYTATVPNPPPPPHTPQPELFSLYDEEPSGLRPDRMPALSGPQERDLRRTVQQIVDTVPLVPLLDDPVPQMVEQLVEVPTIVSYSSLLLLQRIMEQKVDIPVPGRGGRIAGLQGFLPEQSSTAQLAAQERSSERIVEQIVDSRVFGGGLQDFRPGQSSSSSLHFPAGVHVVLDESGEGFCSLFPQNK